MEQKLYTLVVSPGRNLINCPGDDKGLHGHIYLMPFRRMTLNTVADFLHKEGQLRFRTQFSKITTGYIALNSLGAGLIYTLSSPGVVPLH